MFRFFIVVQHPGNGNKFYVFFCGIFCLQIWLPHSGHVLFICAVISYSSDEASSVPRRKGPKRASKIRKLFNLTKKDDVRKYVIRRKIVSKKDEKKSYSKAPKIQRLVTPQTLQRKRQRVAIKKRRSIKQKTLAAGYAKVLAKFHQTRRVSFFALTVLF